MNGAGAGGSAGPSTGKVTVIGAETSAARVTVIGAEASAARVTVIGAGASGLMAALCAARAGAAVTVLEHKSEAGLKLALTGNGRCNYTNTGVSAEHYHCDDPAFVKTVLDRFSYESCITFFSGLGIEPEIRHYDFDELGYVYPRGLDASGFRTRLYEAALEAGVSFRFDLPDAEVLESAWEAALKASEDAAGAGYAAGAGNAAGAGYAGEAGDIVGTGNAAGAGDIPGAADALIIAAGSNAYPMTGSESSAYPLIRRLGLEFHPYLPALCGLYSKDPLLKELKGRRIRDEVLLRTGTGKGEPPQTYTCSGEIQFNEHSISGIPVMQLSAFAAKALNRKETVSLEIGGHTYPIHRTADFSHSQVCSGGISTAEIDPETMRCRAHKNVYVCGECLDVDGECGGFNLHFAWASGYLAGTNAARNI